MPFLNWEKISLFLATSIALSRTVHITLVNESFRFCCHNSQAILFFRLFNFHSKNFFSFRILFARAFASVFFSTVNLRHLGRESSVRFYLDTGVRLPVQATNAIALQLNTSKRMLSTTHNYVRIFWCFFMCKFGVEPFKKWHTSEAKLHCV